jgi:23S rRNA G2069 N7-methylase RlmK/C1962 C5-methylase RlmI
MTDPNEAERQRLDAVRGYGRLLEAKRGLDQGGILIISRNGWTTVPPSIANDIDDALQHLQSGAKLSDDQQQLLERTIVPDIQSEIKNPIPLQATGRSR